MPRDAERKGVCVFFRIPRVIRGPGHAETGKKVLQVVTEADGGAGMNPVGNAEVKVQVSGGVANAKTGALPGAAREA